MIPAPPRKRRHHLPPPPPARDSRSRLRQMVRSHETFEPTRAPTWRGSSRDLVVNPGGFESDLRQLVADYYGKLDTNKSEDQIVSELVDAFATRKTGEALRIANRLLDGHGVEELGGIDSREGPRYLYINFGDTYDPTIMWSRDDNKVFVSMGGWGQFMEDEGEPDMFDEAWNDWLASEFNHALESEAVSRDDREEGDPEGLQAKAMEFIDSDEGTKELFQRALTRAANGAPMGKTPELVWQSDGSLFVPHLDRVVREAVSMIQEGWQPGTWEGHARNGSAAAISAEEVSELPVGSIVYPEKDGRPQESALVVVPAGLTHLALLPQRAGDPVPGGEPAGAWGRSFFLVAQGNGRLPTHGTAQRKVIEWYQRFRSR